MKISQGSELEQWYEAGEGQLKMTFEQVLAKIKTQVENPDTTTHIMVGSDSHSYGNFYHFVTVICAWNEGKGGTYYLKSSLESRKTFNGSSKLRLQYEVTKSLEVAMSIEEILEIKPEVHIDASPPGKKEFSSAFSDILKGYVLSSGYEAILKPASFVSNCIADKHTRKKVRGRKKWLLKEKEKTDSEIKTFSR